MLGHPFRPDEQYLAILDHDQYGRLLREDEAFRSSEGQPIRVRDPLDQAGGGSNGPSL